MVPVVAVVEGNLLGGTCVNIGCVPKKIMWYGAQIAEAIHAYGPDYGFTAENVTFDFATLKKNREAYIDRSRNSYNGTFERNNVTVIKDMRALLMPTQLKWMGKSTVPTIS